MLLEAADLYTAPCVHIQALTSLDESQCFDATLDSSSREAVVDATDAVVDLSTLARYMKINWPLVGSLRVFVQRCIREEVWVFTRHAAEGSAFFCMHDKDNRRCRHWQSPSEDADADMGEYDEQDGMRTATERKAMVLDEVNDLVDQYGHLKTRSLSRQSFPNGAYTAIQARILSHRDNKWLFPRLLVARALNSDAQVDVILQDHTQGTHRLVSSTHPHTYVHRLCGSVPLECIDSMSVYLGVF